MNLIDLLPYEEPNHMTKQQVAAVRAHLTMETYNNNPELNDLITAEYLEAVTCGIR